MQRIIIVLLFLSALTVAYLGGNSRAQQASPQSVLKHTKVGIVNLGLLFNKYDKFKVMKDDLEKMVEPYKTRQKELEKQVRDWTEILKEPSGKLSEKNLVRGQKIIIDCKRQLEDLEQEYKTKVANKAETLLVEVWKDVNERVRDHADRQGFQLILAYGEPEKELATWKIAKRKMDTIDTGGLAHAYAAGGVDISADVLKSLNDSYRAAQPVKNDAAEDGGAK